MIEIKNTNLFGKIIAEALVKIDSNESLTSATKIRWVNAIGKATREIEDHGAFMDWQEEKQTLLIWSDNSNNIYEANGVCQCKAFGFGQPCWHRALAKLIKNYLAAIEPPVATGATFEPSPAANIHSYNNAPYLKANTAAKPATYGSIRI